MYYPRLEKKKSVRSTVSAFRGYEHRLKTSEGAFYDTENLSTRLYPLMSVRKARGIYKKLAQPQGILEKDALAWVDEGALWYNGVKTPIEGLCAGEKQLVSMGAYICIFPDKCYYNTADPTDYGPMEARWSYSGRVSYAMCDADGVPLTRVAEGSAAPDAPEDGAYWLDTREGALKTYSAVTAMWEAIESVYIRMDFTTQGQIPAAFARYDGVTLSGAAEGITAEGEKIIHALGGRAARADAPEEAENDYIVVIGAPMSARTVDDAAISITRAVPELDYVCQCANRLWGCRYGNDGTRNINELYCCALGDFKNWGKYMGLSTDSWRASVGTDGVWTGAVNYLGAPLFFKEGCIHRISPSPTGAHQVGETVCRGVQRGSAKSLVVVDETLYYKSRTDVCAYQGGFPEGVSAALGEESYHAAVAGAYGQRYYISMLNERDEAALFVLDIARGLWMREDALRAQAFARVGDELFCLSAGTLYALNGTCGTPEAPPRWRAETGLLGCEYAQSKYISRLLVRAWMAREAAAELFVEYDSSGAWEYAGRIKLINAGTAELPLRLRRCDHVRVRIEGQGEVKLISLTREVSGG